MAGCGVSAAAPVGFGARVSSVEDVFPDADPDDGEEGFEEGGHGGGIGEELQVVVSFAAQRFGADKDSVGSEGLGDFGEHRFQIICGEMSDGSVPDDDIVVLAGEGIADGIAELIVDIGSGIHASGGGDGGRLDIEGIDASAVVGEECFGEEAVSAADVEEGVSRSDDFGGEEASGEDRRGAMLSISEIEAVPALVVEVGGFTVVEDPVASMLAAVESSEESDEDVFPERAAVEDFFGEST